MTLLLLAITNMFQYMVADDHIEKIALERQRRILNEMKAVAIEDLPLVQHIHRVHVAIQSTALGKIMGNNSRTRADFQQSQRAIALR